MNSKISGLSGRASLAAVTLERNGDGVAYAGVLLQRALASLSGREPYALELAPASAEGPSLGEEARFVLRLGMNQLLHPQSWWLFNHVGIARAQRVVPSLVRRRYAVLLCGVEVWDPALSASRKRTLRSASARIAISEVTARRVRESHGDIGTVVVCPLGLLSDGASPEAADRALLQQVRDSSALIVGRMSSRERYKGHDQLLESWPALLQAVPDAQLIIAGRGDDVQRLRDKAGTLGLDGSVLFAGFVSDETLAALRERVAVFAMPSSGEGFGLVYLDAMRSGLPCIAGLGDAGAEVIVDGETGICVKPSDTLALSQALRLLLTSSDLRKSYGEAGKQRFEALFTFERFCNRLLPILQHAFA